MFILALLMAAAQPVCPPTPAQPPIVTTPTGVRFQTLKPGTGAKPGAADQVLVTYEGHLTDGTLFDASAQPVAFGVSDLIPGFTEALQMMAKGGRYKFWIPSHLAYGPEGAGEGLIPPNAELEFIVNLVDVASPPAEPAPTPPTG
jgi:FKBP-type peptidyl-prolyl cis-trans isomerase FkpA